MDESLIPVAIPPLLTILVAGQDRKGAPLTEAEVLTYRDNAVCMMVPRDKVVQMAEARGYADLDMENAWADWQAFLAQRLEG